MRFRTFNVFIIPPASSLEISSPSKGSITYSGPEVVKAFKRTGSYTYVLEYR